MYFLWLWEVLKRAFTATPRMTDVLQILAASAVPIISDVAGVDLPSDALARVFAYIGIGAISFFVIRLFWAPYSIWKEQGESIGQLKLELSRPERMILERLSKHRAKSRARLGETILEMGLKSFTKDKNKREETINRLTYKAVALAHTAGFGDNLRYIIIVHSGICLGDKSYSIDLFDLEVKILDFLNGTGTTIEEIERLLQKGTEQKIQQ